VETNKGTSSYLAGMGRKSVPTRRRSRWQHNVYFDFFCIYVWNISHSKKNSARYCHKCTNVFM